MMFNIAKLGYSLHFELDSLELRNVHDDKNRLAILIQLKSLLKYYLLICLV